MAEIFNLTTPVVPPTRTTYSIQQVIIDWATPIIQVQLLGSDSTPESITWTDAQATALIIALNKANLSVTSLQKRIFQQAIADGKLPPGTVAGTPA